MWMRRSRRRFKSLRRSTVQLLLSLMAFVMDALWCSVSECFRLLPMGEGLASLLQVEYMAINDRSFRILKQIGSGGYANVYLVREVPTTQTPLVDTETLYAVKKIIAGTGERLTDAKREIDTLKTLRGHPNVVPLLDASTSTSNTDSSLSYHVHLLFPAYQDGTLQEELERLSQQGSLLPTRHILDIFVQICQGLQHMHSQGYCHRDMKPHNVLITRPEHNHPAPSTSVLDEDNDADSQGRSTVGVANGAASNGATQCSSDDATERGRSTASCSGREGRYEAVLMDMGSARPAVVEVNNRMDALALQEDAEVGYHMMYGASPFQEAMDRGASLPLAVLNCRITWPKELSKRYPEDLHALALSCLVVDPEARPRVWEVLQRAQALQLKQLPDPACFSNCKQ